MGIKTGVLVNIAEGQFVQLRCAASTSGIDWKQDRPRDATSNEADQDEQPEEAEKKVAIERLVTKDELVIKRSKVVEPSGDTLAGRRSSVPFTL